MSTNNIGKVLASATIKRIAEVHYTRRWFTLFQHKAELTFDKVIPMKLKYFFMHSELADVT
jgi:hypothetical protein